MNNKYILLFAMLMLNILIMHAQTELDQEMKDKRDKSLLIPEHYISGDTLVYEVFGMDCPGCHGALEKQVNKLSAVDSSAANWLNQEIIIYVKKDSVLIEEELLEKIKSANFTPGEKITNE